MLTVFVDEKNLFFGFLLCLVGTVVVTSFVILPVLLQMVLYTLPIIYLGSHLSLKQAEVDPETGDKPNKSDSMDRRDAMLFPLFGSGALVTLYLAYKFLDPWYVNMLLTAYLTCIGVIALAESLYTFIFPLSCDALLRDALHFDVRLWPFGSKDDPWEFRANRLHVASYALGITTGVLWLVTKHWALHNAFAVAFCIQAIALVAVGDFKVAAILLSGLFIYDIFWVFGTEVMVTVAKAFEGPAKIIFPVQFQPWQQSILGLGDVVIPGIFISMCLRFDNYMHEKALHVQARKHGEEVPSLAGNIGEGQTATSTAGRDDPTQRTAKVKVLNEVDIHEKFGKFYFWVVMVSYELGLLTTGIVMVIFKHPQPALLYLVPYCLISMFGAATLNGEVKELLAYKEDDGKPTANDEDGAGSKQLEEPGRGGSNAASQPAVPETSLSTKEEAEDKVRTTAAGSGVSAGADGGRGSSSRAVD